MLIKNAKILTLAADCAGTGEIENGYILCTEGRIAEVGPMSECPSDAGSAQLVDAAGRTVLPGLVDPHSHIGVFNDAIGFEGEDGNEMTDPVTPHLRAIDAVHHLDRCFEDARAAGVTTVVTGPGSGNVIGGQFAALKTFGRTADEMAFKAPCAMKIAFGENPKTVYNEKHQTPTTRMATAALLRENLFKAQEYLEALEDHEEDPDENDKPDYDMKLEALIPVLKRELVVKAHAHRADDIATALRIMREFDLDMTIDHCTEGWMMADVLAEAGVDVILGPLMTDRSKVELKNQNIEAAGILARAGLPVSIMSDHPCIPVQHLTTTVSVAVREGLDPADALRAITIRAAHACRIADRVGSIEPGKDADFAIFDGDPLDVRTRTAMTIIGGRVVWERR